MIPPFTELGQGSPKGYSFQIMGELQTWISIIKEKFQEIPLAFERSGWYLGGI